MKVQSKQQKDKNQTNRLKQLKQINGQEVQNLQLKMQKFHKQLSSLNQDIESLLQQRNFKENIQKALFRQRKKLQNCFLFNDYQTNNAIYQIQKENMQNETKIMEPSIQKVKNHFRDVNQTILRFITQLQAFKDQDSLIKFQDNQKQEEAHQGRQNRKVQCQSLHLKQIFNSEQSLSHQIKASKLQQKLNLLYEKIKINLQSEEPYLHEKILERIKRRAQSYTRKNLLQQIGKLVKQNSLWMAQETNMVNNYLEEKKVEDICMNNLGLMKKVMAKKVCNNDWIFQNYSDTNFIKGSNSGFPAQKVTQEYREALKKIQEQRIAKQLALVKNFNGKRKKNSEQSLKQLLSDKPIQIFINQKENSQDKIRQSQRQLVERVQKLHKQILNLIKL